jgi:hypothetical protein
MEAGIAAELVQSSRSKPVTTRGVVGNILRRFAEIGAVAKYFLRPRLFAPAERAVERAAVEAGAAGTAPVTADVNVGPAAGINRIPHSIPDKEEIERRRNLVRMLFNDFWSSAPDKPTAFVERLDQAEDYLNERLAANGEFWRLDGEVRAMLGLPPPSNPPDEGTKNHADRP